MPALIELLIDRNHALLAEATATRRQTRLITGRAEVTQLQARIMVERTLAMTSRLGSWEQFVARVNRRGRTW